MNDPSNWKITKTQKQEISELLAKLGWTQEFYEQGLMWKIENSLWHQAVAMISGLEFLLDNPKQWTTKNIK